MLGTHLGHGEREDGDSLGTQWHLGDTAGVVAFKGHGHCCGGTLGTFY